MPSYKKRKCQCCIDQLDQIDYKNLTILRKYTTQYFKIVPRYYSGNCQKHQKRIAQAIKNARFMALVPYTK